MNVFFQDTFLKICGTGLSILLVLGMVRIIRIAALCNAEKTFVSGYPSPSSQSAGRPLACILIPFQIKSASCEWVSVAQSELQEEESPRRLLLRCTCLMRTLKQIWAITQMSSRTFCGRSTDGVSPGVIMRWLFGNWYVLLESPELVRQNDLGLPQLGQLALTMGGLGRQRKSDTRGRGALPGSHVGLFSLWLLLRTLNTRARNQAHVQSDTPTLILLPRMP